MGHMQTSLQRNAQQVAIRDTWLGLRDRVPRHGVTRPRGYQRWRLGRRAVESHEPPGGRATSAGGRIGNPSSGERGSYSPAGPYFDLPALSPAVGAEAPAALKNAFPRAPVTVGLPESGLL